jgi:CubicO group peptidase (beta-lactamase class C family)
MLRNKETGRLVLFLILPFLCAMTGDKTSSNKSSDVDTLFREYDRQDAPGACVMVIKEGEVVYKKAYGMANLEEKTAATTRTNYRLASVTKQFTAMAIMMLAERKKLSYDSVLTDFFTDFPAYGKQITVRQLLSHTSGLIDYEDVIPKETTTPLKDRQALDLLKQQKETYFTPGSKYQYSNSGYALLALIVEKASGLSFATFLEKNIFKPLGMDETVAYEQGVSTVHNRAYGYRAGSNGFERKDQSLTSSVLGDGGIYSSVEDLYKWDQALYTNKLVGVEAIKRAFTPVAKTSGASAGYGFGWYIEEYRGMKTVWHYGSTTGFRTAIERFPDRKFTVIVLLNRNEPDSHKAHALARKVADLYL